MIGVLGGSFNPIHLGHLSIAAELLNKHNLSKILFVPTLRPPHKNHQDLIEARHRLAMVRLAVASNPHFECSDL